MAWQKTIVPRIPLLVVDAVQDAGQCIATRPQRVLHSHAVLIRADLLGMSRTHGRDRIRVHDAVLERVDRAGPQVVLVQQIALGT